LDKSVLWYRNDTGLAVMCKATYFLASLDCNLTSKTAEYFANYMLLLLTTYTWYELTTLQLLETLPQQQSYSLSEYMSSE
jgi:hypothetical protein